MATSTLRRRARKLVGGPAAAASAGVGVVAAVVGLLLRLAGWPLLLVAVAAVAMLLAAARHVWRRAPRVQGVFCAAVGSTAGWPLGGGGSSAGAGADRQAQGRVLPTQTAVMGCPQLAVCWCQRLRCSCPQLRRSLPLPALPLPACTWRHLTLRSFRCHRPRPLGGVCQVWGALEGAGPICRAPRVARLAALHHRREPHQREAGWEPRGALCRGACWPLRPPHWEPCGGGPCRRG